MGFHEISTFTNPAELIREYYFGDPISDDVMFELDHVNDFESFWFLVINGETVVTYDVLNGYVYDTSSIEDYIRQLIEYATQEFAAFQADVETAFENAVIAEMEARNEF